MRLPTFLAVLLLTGAAAQAPAEANSEAELMDCLVNAWEPRACIGTISTPCVQREGETTAAMTGCIARETQAWDGLLNATYQRLMAASRRLDETGDVAGPDLTREATLRQAQRAWIAFRDAECTMQGARWGQGTLRGVAVANCLMAETATRTIALLSFLEE